jgi:hypothetical protein
MNKFIIITIFLTILPKAYALKNSCEINLKGHILCSGDPALLIENNQPIKVKILSHKFERAVVKYPSGKIQEVRRNLLFGVNESDCLDNAPICIKDVVVNEKCEQLDIGKKYQVRTLFTDTNNVEVAQGVLIKKSEMATVNCLLKN